MEKTNQNQEHFQDNSYERHANWYNQKFPDYTQKITVLKSIQDYKGSINHWLQEIFFSCLIPFIKDKKLTWLTVGDAYGHDAKYLLNNGVEDVIASDLNDDFLQISKEIGFIKKYSAENAEKLSLEDNSIDYILCKESYHHFPRPFAALYEMIRVAKKGIIIIEPQDPISKIPLLLFLTNMLEKFKSGLINKVWKNRFSYEEVGNFVYKVSEREFEKFAAGLNLPLVAFKQINPNFWFPGSDKFPAVKSNKRFKKILLKKKIRDVLCRFGALPSQTLSIVVFKTSPSPELKESLKNNGYKLIEIPKNPYL